MQCISDLHLEFYKELKDVPVIPVNAPILVLAGDIGYPTLPLYWEFLENMSKQYEHIILVTGNHEYYHSNARINKGMILSISEIDKLIELQLQNLGLDNIHFLQMSEIILGSIRFIGTTLWSEIPLENEYEISITISDFKRSFLNSSEHLTVSYMNQIYKEHREYLEKALNVETDATKTIVITHHMPSFRLIATEYEKSTINCAFASSVLDELSIKPDIWICGHSHRRMDTMIAGTRVIMNAVGYPGEIPIDESTFQCIEI